MIKGNKLIFDNDKIIYLTKEMFSKFDLKDKTELDDETFYSLIYFRIKLSAYNMLVKRDYFKKELKNKLIEKIGVTYGPTTTTTGGKALKFYSSVRLEVKKMGTVKQGDDPIGSEVIVKVTKNKVAPPFKEAAFEILYGKGISRVGEIIDAAVARDIIVKAGSWFSFRDQSIGQGKEKVRAELETNPELLAQVEKDLKEAIAKGPIEKKKKKSKKEVASDDTDTDENNEIDDDAVESND